MPWIEEHGDTDGNTHEGAALALLDTAGAMAGWAVTGPGPYKASTPSMQAQVLAAPPQQDLIAYAKVGYHDNEILYSDVEVAGKNDQKVYARGTIIYRIVT
jgi:acyl-coenzyme A thioesterase PaaI-like protein